MTDVDALGTRPVGRLLWHNGVQTTLSVGMFGVYSLTNAWFVARGVGADAVAAVNVVAPVLLLLGAVSTTVGVGGASLVSRRLGGGDPAGAARAAGNAFVLYWMFAALVTVAGLVAIEPLLTLLGADGVTREPARDYAVVLLSGALLATGFSAIVRAEGAMRFSTLVWVVCLVVQIVLDPLFIFGFGMGVRGAAIGTVIGFAVGVVMNLWFFFLRRNRPYRIGLRDLRPHGPTMLAVAGVGAPSFLTGFGATLLIVGVNNTLAYAGGAVALAAYAVSARVQTFLAMPFLGISMALQPITGFNTGNGRADRVRRARVLAMRATLGYGVVVAAAVVVFAEPVTGLFLSAGPAADTAVQALRFLAAGVAVAGVAPLVSAYFQAVGRPLPSYVISVGSVVAVKAPLVLVLSHAGTTGVWTALALGELVSAVIALVILRGAAGRIARPAAPSAG